MISFNKIKHIPWIIEQNFFKYDHFWHVTNVIFSPETYRYTELYISSKVVILGSVITFQSSVVNNHTRSVHYNEKNID